MFDSKSLNLAILSVHEQSEYVKNLKAAQDKGFSQVDTFWAWDPKEEDFVPLLSRCFNVESTEAKVRLLPIAEYLSQYSFLHPAFRALSPERSIELARYRRNEHSTPIEDLKWMNHLRAGTLTKQTQEDLEWQDILEKSKQPKVDFAQQPSSSIKAKPATPVEPKRLAIEYTPTITFTYGSSRTATITPMNDPQLGFFVSKAEDPLRSKITKLILANARKPLISMADRLYRSRLTTYNTLDEEQLKVKANEAEQAIRIFFYLDTGIDLENIQHACTQANKPITFNYCDKFMNLLNDAYLHNDVVKETIREVDDPFSIFQHKNLFTLMASVYSTDPELLKKRLAISKVDLSGLERRNRQRIENNMHSYKLRTGYDEYTDTYKKQDPANQVMQNYLGELSKAIDERYKKVGDLEREEVVLTFNLLAEEKNTAPQPSDEPVEPGCGICKVATKPQLDQFDGINCDLYVFTASELFYFDSKRHELTQLNFGKGNECLDAFGNELTQWNQRQNEKQFEALKMTLECNFAEYEMQSASSNDLKQISYFTGHSHDEAVQTFSHGMSASPL